jgi:carbonic anhydrase
MKKTMMATVCAGVLCAGMAFASGQAPHWGYSGPEAAQYWGDLSREYELCKDGHNQSPIDIDKTIEASLSPVIFNYKESSLFMVDNGHTVQVNYAPGSSIVLNGHTFNLLQFHFHTPSENTVKGNHFPMEAHLVHSDGEGNLAVVSVLFEEGAANKALEQIWPYMPEKVGQTVRMDAVKFNIADMLPPDHDYYYFNGSLTTPPCTQGVAWIVLKKPVTVSKAQFKKFHDIIGMNNNRPLQPMNARPVLR